MTRGTRIARLTRPMASSSAARSAQLSKSNVRYCCVHCTRHVLVQERQGPAHRRDVDRQVRAVEDQDLGIQDRHPTGAWHATHGSAGSQFFCVLQADPTGGRQRRTGRRAARVSSRRVEARAVRGLADHRGIGAGLLRDREHRVDELVERLLALGLRRLDHERALHDQRESRSSARRSRSRGVAWRRRACARRASWR